ncbi:MAG: hydrogenase formation protein HypD [Chromatiaceae bacterium]|nr:hydrogenase formation protein HypD [Chromatiaceae bacterium]
MSTVAQLLGEIARVPLSGPVRVLSLSVDHERVINVSGLRRALPEQVRLVSGPGCAASICPQADLYQAIQLARRHPLTLLAADNMLHLPLNRQLPGPHSLMAAGLEGADVRSVSAPVEALIAARDAPSRQMVLFTAGFETLLAPLAGMVLEGLPKNLSVLVCGRRVEPLLEVMLARGAAGFDALLLPGNRCAVTGMRDWERITGDYRIPAAIAGYSLADVLGALHAVLQQCSQGEARVDNRYRALVRADGLCMARDWLDRVFELGDGRWRGLGSVPASGYRLRHAYAVFDADRRFPDYREQAAAQGSEMPLGCECAAVVLGQKEPIDCKQFALGCSSGSPYGPCMASDDGTCHLRSGVAWAA